MRRLLSTAAAVTLLWLSSASPAGGQTEPSPDPGTATVEIDFVSASPWVESEGDWTAELAVSGAPPDARISYSIRQAVTGSEPEVREALAAARDGEVEPKALQAPVTQDLASVTDASGIVRLSVPVRSSSSGDRGRVLIPNSGVYPVVVSIVDGARTTLARSTLYLNRLPTGASPRSAPFRLAILVQYDQPGGFDDYGNDDVTPALRTAVGATADVLAESGALPLSVDVSPESIVALSQSETTGDLELVERLRDALGRSEVLRVPWASLHLEGWAQTGSLTNVQTSLADGADALAARLLTPTDTAVWPPDPTLGANGVELLTKLGINDVVVEPAQLADAKSPPTESAYSRPFRLAGSSSVAVNAMALDPDLRTMLGTASTAPALVAYQMVTLMFGTWLADDEERGAVLRVDETADPDVTGELLALLQTTAPADATPISVVDLREVTALPPITIRQSGRDTPYLRELVAPTEVPRVSGVSDRLRRARALVDDYAAIVPSGDPAAARLAVIVQRSLDRRVTPSAQETLLDDAMAEMEADLDRISASEPRSLTLTTRTTTVPLRFTNDLGRPITVRLRLQSPRLKFLDGDEQLLTLDPGLNRLNVAVEVQASGQFVLQADLLAPDSDRVLATTRQRIRSRTFSGVGLMLSGGALLFLVVWWSRTLRKRTATATNGEPGADAAHR